MRLIKIILGCLCMLGSIWPGCLAANFLARFVWPKLTAAPGVIIHYTVFFAGCRFSGSQIYELTASLALVAVALAVAGLWLVRSAAKRPAD